MKVKFALVGGHPTKVDLARGHKASGKIVSEYNVMCDKACTEAGKRYKEDLILTEWEKAQRDAKKGGRGAVTARLEGG